MKKLQSWHWRDPTKKRIQIFKRSWGVGFWLQSETKQRLEQYRRAAETAKVQLQRIFGGTVMTPEELEAATTERPTVH